MVTTLTQVEYAFTLEFAETATVTSTVYTTVDPTSVAARKRAIATPSALMSYPASAMDSACRRAASQPATKTVYETALFTVTQTTLAVATSTAFETVTSTLTSLATLTTTAIVPVYTDPPCGAQPYGSLWAVEEYGKFDLYCNGYQIEGTVFDSFGNADMANCMRVCFLYYSVYCEAVRFLNDYCWLLIDVSKGSVSPASGVNVAVRVG